MMDMDILRKNVSDMLKTRKYTSIYTKKQEALFQFPETKKPKNFTLFARGEKKVNKKIHACEAYVANSDEKIGVREIRTTIDECIEKKLKSIILVTINKMTFFAQRECKDKAIFNKINIEVWTMEELSFNVLTHVLQPKFLILSSREKEELSKKYDNFKLLPKMLTTDPVCKFLGAQRGTIVSIQRELPSGTIMQVHRMVY